MDHQPYEWSKARNVDIGTNTEQVDTIDSSNKTNIKIISINTQENGRNAEEWPHIN